MKLGVSMYSYVAAYKKGMDIPGFIDEARRLGVDGVELLDYFWSDRAAETPAVKEALERTGLKVGVYSVSNDLVIADPAQRAEQVRVLKRGVDSAVEYGAGVVRVFAGNTKEGVSFDQAFNWIVDGLREASQYASKYNVKLALENHGLLAGKSEQVRRILDAVDSPFMMANPDTGNFLLVHQAPHEALRDVVEYAAMVHFKDFHEVPESHEGFAYTSLDGLRYIGTAIGEGDVALETCVNELRAAGFDGWLNIEYEGAEDPMTALPRSINYTRGLLGEL